MPKLFAVSIILFLFLGAGYGAIQAARSIPWDCSDWQAFAHADRTTAILESLAENRGKTLYCGIDQSDTFTKAETWAAGRDRNERDDTVYWGERGSFRGFIAAQEGWLTEGESGITGQSIATIFEFPKEERQRRRKQYRRDVVPTDIFHWVWSAPGPEARSSTDYNTANISAQGAFVAPTDAERNRWGRSVGDFHHYDSTRIPREVTYSGGASGWCRHLGYDRAVNVDTYLATGGSDAWGMLNYRAGPGETGDYISRARRPIRFNNVDCVRRK